MKSLEQQENVEGQESIEATYKKSPNRLLTLHTVQEGESPEKDGNVLNPEDEHKTLP